MPNVQTCISIGQVGSDAPRQSGSRTYGPAGSAQKVTILNGFAREFRTREAHGAFSLKWIPRGAACYVVDRIQHRVAGEKVLLLHPGQAYGIDFLDRRGTESFCLFFSQSLFQQALTDFAESELLPVLPSGRSRNALTFADMVFRPLPELMAILHQLRRIVGDPVESPERLEETLLFVLNDLMSISQAHRRLAERIPAKRPMTRRLLLARLQRAKEMIEDHQGRPRALDDLAQASCLSKFHLLRLFEATFGASPIAYANRCRIERSKALLRHTQFSIGQIAEKAGYESQEAFTRMFRRHVGVTPHVFRAG